MNLTTFKKPDYKPTPRKSDKPLINVCRKSCQFTMNVWFGKHLGLEGGEQIVIAKDEDSRNDWYLRVGKELTDYPCITKINKTLRNGGKYPYFRARNKAASHALLDSVGAVTAATFLIAARPTKMPDGTLWYRIITSRPERVN